MCSAGRASQIIFSDKAVIRCVRNHFYFMFQVGEASFFSYHPIVEAHVRVYAVLHEELSLVKEHYRSSPNQGPTTRETPPESPTARRPSLGSMGSLGSATSPPFIRRVSLPGAIHAGAELRRAATQRLSRESLHACSDKARRESSREPPKTERAYFQTRVMRLTNPNDELGGMLFLATPQVVSHRIDKWSPIFPAGARRPDNDGDHDGNAYHFPGLVFREADREVAISDEQVGHGQSGPERTVNRTSDRFAGVRSGSMLGRSPARTHTEGPSAGDGATLPRPFMRANTADAAMIPSIHSPPGSPLTRPHDGDTPSPASPQAVAERTILLSEMDDPSPTPSPPNPSPTPSPPPPSDEGVPPGAILLSEYDIDAHGRVKPPTPSPTPSPPWPSDKGVPAGDDAANAESASQRARRHSHEVSGESGASSSKQRFSYNTRRSGAGAIEFGATGNAATRGQLKRMQELIRQHLQRSRLEVVVVVEAIDPHSSNTFQARHSYTADDIEFDKSFVGVMAVSPDDGMAMLDWSKFHQLYDVPFNAAQIIGGSHS